MDLPEVTIFSDGACEPNPGPGGWGALLRYGSIEKEISGGEPETTNNRMELTAAIKALQALQKPCKVVFYTDSQYLRKGVTEWMAGWRRRGWKRKDGELANVDLWMSLDQEIGRHQISWNWVRGHAGHPENERVDQLASRAIRRK